VDRRRERTDVRSAQQVRNTPLPPTYSPVTLDAPETVYLADYNGRQSALRGVVAVVRLVLPGGTR